MGHEHKHGHSNWQPETQAVAAGRPPHIPGAPVNYPIGLSTTFHAGMADHGYIREGTVGTEALEAILSGLEHGHAVVFSSGIATVSALLDLLPAGGVVVAPNHAYPGTNGRMRELAEVGRIILREVPADDPTAVASACIGADLLWLETPTNPLMEISDLRSGIAAIHAAGGKAVVDNTFMSPARQLPLELGADFSMHSATKYIAGHSDSLMGALIAADEEQAALLKKRRVMLGSFPGSLETFLAIRGLRTLHLRMDRAEANALVIAERLSNHPKVSRVRYPGLPSDTGHTLHFSQASGGGAVVCFEIHGDAEEATRVTETTQLWAHATSLGGVESTLERRRRWPAESMDTPDNLIRLSVGIEHVEDLWADLAQALG